MLTKPPHGAPCNSCGLCCREQLCPLGAAVFRGNFNADPEGPCPALERDGERQICGLVAHPMAYAMVQTLKHGTDKMREAAAKLVGAGFGCDAHDPREPENVDFMARLRRETAGGQWQRGVSKWLKLWGVQT